MEAQHEEAPLISGRGRGLCARHLPERRSDPGRANPAPPNRSPPSPEARAVKIAPAAMKRSEDAFKVLCKAAGEGQMIYGLTVGVGLNKDRKFVDAKGELTQEVIDASSKFQTGLIRAHSGSVGAGHGHPHRPGHHGRPAQHDAGGRGGGADPGDRRLRQLPEQGRHPLHAQQRLHGRGGHHHLQPRGPGHDRRRRSLLQGQEGPRRRRPQGHRHEAGQAVRQGRPGHPELQRLLGRHGLPGPRRHGPVAEHQHHRLRPQHPGPERQRLAVPRGHPGPAPVPGDGQGRSRDPRPARRAPASGTGTTTAGSRIPSASGTACSPSAK